MYSEVLTGKPTDMTKLIGPFTRIRTLGAGGGAKVFAAWDALGREVAVKVPHTGVGAEPIGREVAAAALLDHPNIVRVLDFGHSLDQPWMAMEAAAHGTLEDHPPKTIEEIDAVVSRVLEALSYAHARHILHLDLKPSNILLIDPEKMDVKLADFGQSTLTDEPEDPRATPVGTPQYMAPEQFSSATHLYGPWTDLYALGCIVFEWSYGRPPFIQGDFLQMGLQHSRESLPTDPKPIIEIPPALVGWIRRALAKPHGVRFQGAMEAFEAWRKAVPESVRHQNVATPQVISPRLASLRAPPFVGRAAQLSLLGQVLDEAILKRAPRLVLVHGPLGIGKSRLAKHFAELEETSGRARWFYSHFSAGDLVDPIALMLANALGVSGKSVVEAPTLITERLGTHYSVDALMGVVQATLLGNAKLGRLTPSLAHRVTASALQEISGARIPIIILDDIHHAIDAVDFCEDVLKAKQGAALIIAIIEETTDNLVRERVANWREKQADLKIVDISVPTLTPQQVDDMLSDWVALPAERRADIVIASKGMPLVAVANVKHGSEAPPEHGLENVWARVLATIDEQLPVVGRAALEVGAAIGTRVDESLWSDVLTQLGYPPNPKTLMALERLGAIQRKGRSWVFDHPGLQIAVAATVEGTGWWQEIHHQAARVLAERHASPWDIGQHLEASGDKESPISPWLAAAYQAAVCESPHVAQQIQQKAIRALQALDVSMDDPRWGHAILVQLHIDAQTKPFADAEEIARDLIARADDHGWHDILAEALEVHMRVLHALGRYADALEAGERARLTIRVEGNELTLARITGEMAEILHLSGRSQEALSYLHDALDAYRQLDETEGMACALALAGDILAPEKPMKARECYEEALEFTRRMSLKDLEAHILEGMAKVDHAQGKVTDAMLGFDRAEVTYGSVGATAVWITRYHRGYVRLRAGQREGLLEVFDQCAEAFAEIGVHRYSMNATAALLECASIENDQFLIMTQLRVLEAELDPLDRCAEIETPLREAHAALSKSHIGLARTVRELLAHIGAE